ncbi:MAG TPA: transcription termination factor NusA [Beutenbergiaceae bacterium]|nr:transcription termination factor NusA [Beutenbergiaceae bacterium]
MEIDMSTLRLIETDRDIPLDTLVETIEQALLSAYRQTPQAYEYAPVDLDRRSGKITIYAREEEEGPEFEHTPEGFGRVATTTARQVIMQRIRDAEDDQVMGTFRGKEGDIVAGIIQQGPDPRTIFVDIGGVEARLPQAEQVPGETYDHGMRLRVYVVEVRRGFKGPEITVSRTHPNFVRRLFAFEVPEIADGSVVVGALAREAGFRTKIAVYSTVAGLGAKGACIGPLGQRVRAVMSELGGEKIDIVDFSEDPVEFITAALSPARVSSVEVLDEANKVARAIVPDFQLSLASGKEGQNVRLAARLTGWKIDIRSDADPSKPVAGAAQSS